LECDVYLSDVKYYNYFYLHLGMFILPVDWPIITVYGSFWIRSCLLFYSTWFNNF